MSYEHSLRRMASEGKRDYPKGQDFAYRASQIILLLAVDEVHRGFLPQKISFRATFTDSRLTLLTRATRSTSLL